METRKNKEPVIDKKTRDIKIAEDRDTKQIESELLFDANMITEYQKVINRYKRWEANIPAMVYLLKMYPDGRFEFTYVSSASKKLLGFEPEDIVQNYGVFVDLMELDDFDNFVIEMMISVCKLSQFKYEARFKINGETRWFEFTAIPEPQDDESVIWDGIMLDITKRKKDEEEINEERNLMCILMENIPDSIYFKDLESRFINKIEKEIHISDKETWVSSTKVPLRDRKGNIKGTFGVSRDITEWIKMKNIVDEEHNLMSTIINTIPDNIFVKDIEGHFILNNSAHIQSLGVYSQEQLKTKTEFDLIPYDIANAHQKEDQSIIESGTPLLRKEEEIIYGSIQGNWHLTTKVPLLDRNKKIVGIVGISHNISDIKNIQEQLKSSESRLRHINNAVSAILYTISIFGKDLTLIWVGDNIKQFGYNTEELLNHEWQRKFIYPDDKEYYESNFSNLFTQSKSILEYRVLNKDGHVIWLRDERVLTYNSEGKPLEIFGSWLDITERMQAEEALLNSETQLANALKIANLGHWEFDIVNDFFTFNDQYYSLLHTCAEKEGGYIMSSSTYSKRFLHADDASIISREIHNAINSTDSNFRGELEHQILYPDGGIGQISTHYFITKNEEGRTVKAYGVIQDITERKEAEETLRAKEYLLRQSQSVARIGSFNYNIKAKKWESSQTLDEILGIDGNYSKDLKGWVKVVHSMYRSTVIDTVRLNVSKSQRIEKEYKIKRHNDGQERWVLGIGDLEFDDAGKPVSLIGTIQDITDRIFREQEKHELEKQLRQRNIELEKMICDLKNMQNSLVRTEKMASIGQLSAGIAHEINNPLAYLSSNINRLNEYFDDTVELLQKWQNLKSDIESRTEISSKLEEIDNFSNEINFNFILQNYKRLIKSVQEGALRIKKIVEGMRGFSHTTDTSFGQASINQAITDTLTIVWNEIKYKANVDKNLQELPDVYCNIGEIKQVLVNLLVNAAHSIKEQGTINISTFQDNGFALIKITDTGSGITEENLKRIFDPFFTTKKVGEGTGLGLWICSTIIEKHNGSITVESSIGNGSTFTIKLPITQESEKTQK